MKIIWDISAVCNLDCKYCGAKENLQSQEMIMDYTKYETIINNFSSSVEEIDLLGGEPFLIPGFEDIVSLLEKKDIMVNIITNGQINILDRLKKYKNIKNLSISLDGNENVMNIHRGYGTYQKAWNFLEEVLELKKKNFVKWNIGINIVLSVLNCENIQLFIDEWIKMGVDYISITPLRCEGNAKKNAWLILEANKLLDVYEKIAEYVKTNKCENKIELDVSIPYLSEYLNAKFGTRFPIEKNKCKAAEEVIYMNNQGYISSCRTNTSFVGDLSKESLSKCYPLFSSFLLLKEVSEYVRVCDCIYAYQCKTCCLDNNTEKLEICMQIDQKYNILKIASSKMFILSSACCFYSDPSKNLYIVEYLNREKVHYIDKGFEILMTIKECLRNINEIAEIAKVETEIAFRFLIQEYTKGHIEMLEV